MSMEDKARINEAEAVVTRLFRGREPSAELLNGVPLLDAWTVRMDRYGHKRMLSLVGYRKTRIGELSVTAGELRWLDRKERFAITYMGLWRLGERDDEMPMVLPPMEDER